jgi:ribosome maturation factor RimP
VSATKEQVMELVSPVVRSMDLILVDVAFEKMGKNSVLRIYIDRTGGLDIDTCERFHRQIVDFLEDVSYEYLEVSSPGDRPLKSDADFVRMQGREVEIKLYAAQKGGKKNFEGVLQGRHEDIITITSGGQTHSFAQKDVASVRPLFRID